MKCAIQTFPEPLQVIGEVGDVLLYRAPDGVPFYGVEADGRAGGDLVGATNSLQEREDMEGNPS